MSRGNINKCALTRRYTSCRGTDGQDHEFSHHIFLSNVHIYYQSIDANSLQRVYQLYVACRYAQYVHLYLKDLLKSPA